MRTTKMSAMRGSTEAAIILLRSAGVFPSNRAMTFNSRPPARRLFQTPAPFGSLRRRRRLRVRAAEVCGHVETQADERVARRRRLHRRRLRARQCFDGHRPLRDSERRRRGRVRVGDAFQLDRVYDDELPVGLYVAYEA